MASVHFLYQPIMSHSSDTLEKCFHRQLRAIACDLMSASVTADICELTCVVKSIACFVISTVLLLVNWVSCSVLPSDTAEVSGLAVAALVHVTQWLIRSGV